eukprot:Nitzschia sp. Nitz4//scaffold5_size260463//233491//234849//NITZ4_001026-RA/size260463-processed-gene-0.99-mRNA-1//1//CDS//3329555472//7304//frame0
MSTETATATATATENEKEVAEVASKEQGSTMFLIRLLYLTYYMAISVIQPFLPVYYESLGYKGQIIGLIGSITPFTTFLVGPIWGAVSDKYGAPFLILYLTILIALIGQVAVGMVDDPYTIMALVTVQSVFGAPVRSLIDSLVLQQLKDRSHYGKLRLWSLLGTGFGTSLAGSLLNDKQGNSSLPVWDSSMSLQQFLLRLYESMLGYRLLFLAHVLLHIPVLVTLFCFQRNRNPKGKSDKSGKAKGPLSLRTVFSSVFTNPDALIFFFAVYLMGVAGGIAENFTYVRFREVGGTGLNMGLSRLFSSCAGAVMFYYSGTLGKWLGAERVMVVSLLAVALRFGLFAIMDNPTLGYFAETLRGLTFGVFWSTSILYASQLAPDSVRATMLLVFNGLYNGIGRSTGAIMGGKIQAQMGTSNTFVIGSIANVVFAVFFLLYHSVLRNWFTSSKKKAD